MFAAKLDRPVVTLAPAPGIPPARAQFVAAIGDEKTREMAASVAAQLGYANTHFIEGGAEVVLAYVKAASAPPVVVVDISDSSDPLATMGAIVEICPSTRIVAIGMVNDVGLYRRLIEMGVADYLVKPVYGPALAGALQVVPREIAREPSRAKAARLIALIGARGGVGTTTIAVSAAWTMSQEKRMSVVLVDLDLHFGSLALSLDLDLGGGFREILTNPSRIDGLLIRSSMSEVNDHLRVLGAEEPLEDTLNVGPDGLEALLANLNGSSDVIIVDLPRSLDRLSRFVLAQADVVGIVTEQSLPAMRDTQRLLALMKSLRDDAKPMVIANRVGGVSGEVGRVDFERGIGAKIDFSVPFDTKTAVAAAERAKAFVEVARDARTAAALRELATDLSGVARPPKLSLLRRMLGK